MNNDNSYTSKNEDQIEAWVGCFNCGNPVKILLPFVGCVYCNECQNFSSSIESIGTEDFTPHFHKK